MPGFDGTGPRGLGPMTGKGNGYCMLKMPRTPGEPLTGFAGLPGYPVCSRTHGIEIGLESLCARVRTIEAAIHATRSRLAALETATRKHPRS